MKYTKLGNSDLNVSRICMGCMGFGDATRGQHSWTLDEEHSREIIKRGLDLGVNFYDTAIAYQSGTSEQYVGRALRDMAKREDIVVATKFLPRTPEEIAKANAIAEKEGFAKFVSIQGHYNLIFREEEREMVPYCEEENIALTPYSALASGRLSRRPGEGDTRRAAEDTYAKFKYDATKEQDDVIIGRVAELAGKHGVTMTEVSLAWLLTKVTSPVVGATKLHHIEGAAKAVDLELTDAERNYLEEPYVPHPLAGVMAQNKRTDAAKKHVWSTGDQKIEGGKEQ